MLAIYVDVLLLVSCKAGRFAATGGSLSETAVLKHNSCMDLQACFTRKMTVLNAMSDPK